jgi:ribosome-associated heat shock protein Hsp15
LDVWLWAARFYKTRAAAAGAIEAGQVQVNDERVKRGKRIRSGDRVRIRLGPYEYRLSVRGLAMRRGPAATAQALYQEDLDSRERREWLRAQHRIAPPSGKPDKRARRQLRRLRNEDP